MTAEHKRGKRKWLRWSIVLLLSTGGLLVLIISGRPSWQTARLPLQEEADVLVVKVPEHWRWRHNNDWSPALLISPPQPTGLLRWWDEHVLKMDTTEWEHKSIEIITNERPASNSDSGRKELEAIAAILIADGRRRYRDVKITRFIQQGMSACDVELRKDTMITSNGSQDVRYVFLNNYNAVRKRSTMITVQMSMSPRNYSRVKPTMDEIIRRLRLVQK